MAEKQRWKWTFLGFESVLEGRPVQTWFKALPDDAKYEIGDLVNHMQNVTNRLWGRPEFDALEGAGGISEIRQDIRGMRGVVYYRLYGYFGPNEHEYTFLHGTAKKVRNDINGKRIAKKRFDRLQRGEAGTGVHKFNFS